MGALKATSPVFEIEDEDPRTWTSHLYPVRFEANLIVRVPIDKGVRLQDVRSSSTDPALWSWVYRGSLNEVPAEDAHWILNELHATEPKLGAADPEPGEVELVVPELDGVRPTDTTGHRRIQGMLVSLGRDLGLDVWVAATFAIRP